GIRDKLVTGVQTCALPISIGMYKQHGWPFFLAVPVGVVAGIVVGGLVEFLVIRRFWNTSRLIVTVASIGLAQVLGYIELRGSKRSEERRVGKEWRSRWAA